MTEDDFNLIKQARRWAPLLPSQLLKADILRLLELAGFGPGYAAYNSIKFDPADPVSITGLNQLLDMIPGVPPE